MRLKIGHTTLQPLTVTVLFAMLIACGYIGYGRAADTPDVAPHNNIKQNDFDTTNIVELVAAGAKNRESRLQSPSAYFSRKTFISQQRKDLMKKAGNGALVPASGPQLSKYFWVSDGLRWRCDENDIVPNNQSPLTQNAYDGEKFYSYTPSVQEGQTSELSRSSDFNAHLYWLMVYYNEKPISQFLQTHTTKFLGYQEIDGNKTIKLSVDDGTLEYDKQIYFWFDPKLGMAVRQIEIVVGRKGKGPANAILIKALEFKELTKEFWIPQKAERQMFGFENGKAEWLFTDFFEAQEMLLNTPNTSCLFTIDFPVGTKLIREPDNKIRVVGGRVDENELSQEAAPVVLNPNQVGALQ